MQRQPGLVKGPLTWGTPGKSIDNDQNLIQAGAAGERAVARAIEAAFADRPDVYVFHDLDARNGQNVDHVVVCGDLAVVIDAKTWAPGNYVWQDNGTDGWCWRDDEPFKPGALHGTVEIAHDLIVDCGWTHRKEALVAVVPSRGDSSGLNFDAYDPPHVGVVTVDELGDVLTQMFADVDHSVDVLHGLRALIVSTRDADITGGPFADAPLGDPPANVKVPASTAAHADIPKAPWTSQIIGMIANLFVWVPAPIQGHMPSRLAIAAWSVVTVWAVADMVRFSWRLRPHQDGSALPLRRFREAVFVNADLHGDDTKMIEPTGWVAAIGLFMTAFLPTLVTAAVWAFENLDGARNDVAVFFAVVTAVGAGYMQLDCFKTINDQAKKIRSLYEGDGWQREWESVFVLLGQMHAWQLPLAAYALRQHSTLASEAYLNAAASGVAGEKWQRFAEVVRSGHSPLTQP